MHIVTTEGRDALTIARLAEEAGAAVGALYRYFDGKDALLAGLQIRALEAFDARLAASLAGAPLARVVAVARAWQRFALEEPALHGLLDESLSHPAPMLADARALEVDVVLGRVLSRCDEALDAAVAAGVLAPGPTRLRTLALWTALHGADHLRKRDRLQPEALRTHHVVDTLLDALLRGWGADPAVLGPLLDDTTPPPAPRRPA